MFEIRARNCEALMTAEVDKTRCGLKPENLEHHLQGICCGSAVAELLSLQQ